MAEEAAKLLAVDWEIIDIPEPPDFEIRSDGEILGLEIREIFIDGEAAYGSPLRKAESDHRALVRAVARRYYDAGGAPLYVKILGRLSRSSLDEVVQTLLSLTLDYAVSEPPSNDVVAKVAGVKLFLKPLPASFENYSRWVLLTDQVGWVRRVVDLIVLGFAADPGPPALSAGRPGAVKEHEGPFLRILADQSGRTCPTPVSLDVRFRPPSTQIKGSGQEMHSRVPGRQWFIY